MDELMMLHYDLEMLLILLLLHKMLLVEYGSQFDKMKKFLDTVLCHLYIHILKKMVSEMLVKHFNFSSFVIITLNSIHLVIVLATEIDISIDTGTTVQMVVQHCKIVMTKGEGSENLVSVSKSQKQLSE